MRASLLLTAALALVVSECGGDKQPAFQTVPGTEKLIVDYHKGPPPKTTEEAVLPKLIEQSGADSGARTVVYGSQSYTTYVTPEGIPYCQKEGEEPTLTFSFSSPVGSGNRDVEGGSVRAQTFGKRAVVEYFRDRESLSLTVNEAGKATLSGSLQVNPNHPTNDPIVINSADMECKVNRKQSDDKSGDVILEFDCSGDSLDIDGEALIPKFNQWSDNPKDPKFTTPRTRSSAS